MAVGRHAHLQSERAHRSLLDALYLAQQRVDVAVGVGLSQDAAHAVAVFRGVVVLLGAHDALCGFIYYLRLKSEECFFDTDMLIVGDGLGHLHVCYFCHVF